MPVGVYVTLYCMCLGEDHQGRAFLSLTSKPGCGRDRFGMNISSGLNAVSSQRSVNAHLKSCVCPFKCFSLCQTSHVPPMPNLLTRCVWVLVSYIYKKQKVFVHVVYFSQKVHVAFTRCVWLHPFTQPFNFEQMSMIHAVKSYCFHGIVQVNLCDCF